jgi:hypothetical protein
VTVTVDVRSSVQACCFLQIRPCGFRQFLNGKASRFVFIGRQEPFFVRNRFLFLRQGFGGGLRAGRWGDHGTKGSSEGIGRSLRFPPVVEVRHGRSNAGRRRLIGVGQRNLTGVVDLGRKGDGSLLRRCRIAGKGDFRRHGLRNLRCRQLHRSRGSKFQFSGARTAS